MPLLRRASTEKKIGDGVGRRCRGSFFLDGEFVASNGRRQSFARVANEARNWRRTTEGLAAKLAKNDGGIYSLQGGNQQGRRVNRSGEEGTGRIQGSDPRARFSHLDEWGVDVVLND
ncbi:aliphatic sulfonates import ATP-binding protein SsuB [Striga asiatica]|uniref:Aliphatic sulfonates import ATP-binding protein SsuB n=1 Tax=Striga asiatica TaxID=4170 RepID=A0A5A7QXB8_STRAF|nr:aliphatic sulfonates import ATP-binding protein SsuB [Striga asiatica]